MATATSGTVLGGVAHEAWCSACKILRIAWKYSTCIIGCGNVAGMYGGMNNSRPQTHASAYINNPNTEIIAVVEPDEDKAMVFCEKWNIDQHFSSIDLMQP